MHFFLYKWIKIVLRKHQLYCIIHLRCSEENFISLRHVFQDNSGGRYTNIKSQKEKLKPSNKYWHSQNISRKSSHNSIHTTFGCIIVERNRGPKPAPTSIKINWNLISNTHGIRIRPLSYTSEEWRTPEIFTTVAIMFKLKSSQKIPALNCSIKMQLS